MDNTILKEIKSILKSMKIHYIFSILILFLIICATVERNAESVYLLLPASIIAHISRLAIIGVIAGTIGGALIYIRDKIEN
ncbi:hypothetical protein [Oceanobacillus oncorhynchi]|uniref:hypothetical protein n=1 Tax=Oceanobacillus oncorhynchi TaxID=545501 RepID=UPI001865A86D|nr:hypothetical protein [Oceanobacillus oncorhynchi]